MRADDFLNEGGLRSWIAKLGKDAYDYAASQAPKVKNYIDQPKGGTFGGRVPASPEDATHVYRNMSPEELEAARKSGYFEKNPSPGKTDWDTDKKYWSQGDTEGYFGRAWKDTPDNAQVRLPQEKLPRWTAGRTSDAEVLDKATNTWSPVKENTEQDYLSQIPNLSWQPVNRSVWNTIQDEGLDEEQAAYDHTDWVMASLSIDPKDAQALQAFDDDAIEDFNRFDIHLKSRYPGLTDLIDYDRGTVTIVKPINVQDLNEDNPDYDEDRFLKSDPGTPIPFPKGTTLVDVSDVYDWYKLGMAISDLDDADPRTFNKGVPHTVFAFGSEEEEHKMMPLLKRLGFNLHDIDTPQDYAKAIRAEDAIPYLEQMIKENFADGKVKGKSRPGRVKRAGASCDGSVTDLRQRAKNASGERAKMYHWCANMKSGRNKK